jgi:hypothetical protein
MMVYSKQSYDDQDDGRILKAAWKQQYLMFTAPIAFLNDELKAELGMKANKAKKDEEEDDAKFCSLKVPIVVVKESVLDVNLSNLAIEKENGGVGTIPIFDSCKAASLTCVHHKCIRITSEFARLFVEPTCSVVRYRPDAGQSA